MAAFLHIQVHHNARTPSMMMAPARAAISSADSFMPPDSQSSVSVRLPETIKEQKRSSRSELPV